MPGKFATSTGTVVAVPPSQPASSIRASSRSRPIEAPTPGSRREVNRLARLSYRPPEAMLPNCSQPVDRRLEDDAGVVVEPAGQAEIERDAVQRHAGGVEQVEHGAEVGDSLGGGRRATRAASALGGPRRRPCPVSTKSRTRRAVVGQPAARRPPAGFSQLGEDAVAADLGELVEGPEHGGLLVDDAEGLEQAVEHLAVVQVDGEIGHAGGGQGGVDHLGGLGVGEALSVPTVSKSHWTNSRNRPFAGRSPRKTEPMAYRLKGDARARRRAWR